MFEEMGTLPLILRPLTKAKTKIKIRNIVKLDQRESNRYADYLSMSRWMVCWTWKVIR
jgi:hypothetical protein